VERRFSTRDLGLDVRMAIALALILAIYVAWILLLLAGLISAIRDGSIRGVIGFLFFLTITPLILWNHYADSAGDVLRATRAKPSPEGDLLVPVAERLAAQADVRAPDVLVAASATPNALAVPTRGKPLIVVTSALITTLDPAEMEAVLAHEVTHIANRDGAVMTFVGGPALAASSLWHDDLRGKFVASIMSPVWLLGVLLMRGVSRYREYTADRGSALLTGAPQQLMSALVKIHGVSAEGDLRGGAAISALCIRGVERAWLPILQDHPPLDRRLKRLSALARELGKPVA
jgi:heat shock protein HtpX